MDVLWVIDDSTSMSDLERDLAKKPVAWFDAFDSVEAHIGAVTTDVSPDAPTGIVWGDNGCPDDVACFDAWSDALAKGRSRQKEDGTVVLALKRAWSDGTTWIELSPA